MFSFRQLGTRARPTEQDALRPSLANSYGTSGTAAPESTAQAEFCENGTKDKKEFGWAALPRKGQLLILAVARLSEPLAQTSLQAYMFHQLHSFDESLPESTIAAQAGFLQSCFTGAQFFTSVAWGRAADAESGGRKRVLLIGLVGTAISCLGFGFSTSFLMAAAFRTLGGALNGNVGVINTMVNEIVRSKEFQSRAFLLIPMCFNIGVIIGPALGGMLAEPINTYPGLFGDHSVFGGVNGVRWMKRWPYALPNVVNALFLGLSFLIAAFALEETHEQLKSRYDCGLRTAAFLRTLFQKIFRGKTREYYTPVPDSGNGSSRTAASRTAEETETEEASTLPPCQHPTGSPESKKLPFKRIWTRDVVVTLLAHAALGFHYGTFNNLWFIFLSASRKESSKDQLPFKFTGGLGLKPSSVGIAMAALGLFGIAMQLTLYPALSARLGTVTTYRISLGLFPIVYLLVPYLRFLSPQIGNGALVWTGMASVLLIQVIARTFSYPATMILVNNCSPHPSVLATIHGLAQSAVSATRTLGPVLIAWVFGLGLGVGVVGLGWWVLAISAMLGLLIGFHVREGSGREVLLVGEPERE